MASEPEDRELEPERVAELLSAGEAQVVDVRTSSEHEAGRLAGAGHIPFEELPSRAAELDRSRPIVFYCRSGDRSASAAEAFAASGWEASSMAGGLAEWAERGLPLEPEDGQVASMSGLPEVSTSA
jgi:rhodanese-related sulfurtransferase